MTTAQHAPAAAPPAKLGDRDRLLNGIPLTDRRLVLAGIQTAVLDGGDGPDLVLLHGAGEFAGLWTPVLPALLRSRRVVVPDLPGHGASAAGPSMSADDVLAWLGELIERTCAEPPTIVGRGLGGAIAARFAASRPSALARLVLVGSLGLSDFAPVASFAAALHAFQAQPTAESRDRLFAECFVDLDRLRDRMGERWQPLADYALAGARAEQMRHALSGLMPAFGLSAIPDPDLARVVVPTALIWGRDDRQAPLAVAEAASARHGWPLLVVDNAGDDPPMEQPEAFLAALRTATRSVAGVEVARLDGGERHVTATQLTELGARIDGRLLRAGDTGWDEAITIWNGMAATTPALVAQPMSARDVAAVVDFAVDQDLAFSVKGGGHHIAGTAILGGGLVIDLSALDAVEVDPGGRLARVGAGCRLADVDRATQEQGLATPLGFVSEVGVSGLTLGGGLGYLTRRFGWTVDNLREVEIVTADGRIRRASEAENAEMFWAVRGAGANLGVVTSLTFVLHEVGPTVYGGLIGWPFERSADVLDAYRRLTAQAPRELAAWLLLLRAPAAPFVSPPFQGRRMCAMAICFSGDLAEVDRVLTPVRELGEPVLDLLQARPYTEMQSLFDGTEPAGAHYYWRTEYLAGLSDELLDALPRLFAGCPMPEADIGLLHIGGALNDRADDDDAVGNRDARFVLGIKGMWQPGEPDAAAYVDWVRAAGEEFRGFSTGSTYVNFQTADEGVARVEASYGRNLARLRAVKRAYDPGNVFRSNRNIPAVAGQPAG